MLTSQRLTGIFLSVILISAAALYPIIPDKDFSENENRVLAKFPHLNIDSIFSGEFTSGLEKYLTDNIAGRDIWMSIASDAEIEIGMKEINGVYLADDGYLIDRFTDSDIDEKQFKANTAAIKSLCEQEETADKVTVIPVPDKGSVLYLSLIHI